MAYITGETDESPRKHFFYVSDDGDLTALRFDNWKFVFLEQRCGGTLQIWAEPYVQLRVPKLFNLRTDPYERANITSNTYYDWMIDRIFLFVPAQAYVAKMLETLVEFPQRQKSASFSLDQVMAKLQDATTGSSSASPMERDDPLPSWRPGGTRDALEAFLAAAEAVPVADRVAYSITTARCGASGRAMYSSTSS